jgi:hypothetical protein
MKGSHFGGHRGSRSQHRQELDSVGGCPKKFPTETNFVSTEE